jgi:hypothetical protein
MGRLTVNLCSIARSSLHVLGPQPRRAALLGVLLLAAGPPAGGLAGVGGAGAGGRQVVPSARPGPGSSGAPHAAAGYGKQQVFQLQGSAQGRGYGGH